MEPRLPELCSLDLERAFRWASVGHAGQVRRDSGVPYVEHVLAVALILDHLGFPEPVVIAGTLHDLVEDTEATIEQVEAQFGREVAELVAHCTEIKYDANGRKRPWLDRKRDHLDALRSAPLDARAIVLADKLHNLRSIELDLLEGRAVWSSFHAERDQVLWYYRETVQRLGHGSQALEVLAERCREVLEAIEAWEARSE